MAEANDVKRMVTMVRRDGAEAVVNLVQRRVWFDEEPAPPTTPQEGQEPENAGGGGKTPETPELLNLTQDSLNQMMGDRAKQAQRSQLKDLGVESIDTLKSMIEAYKQAETKRLADEEAAKSELQKESELKDAAIALQVKQDGAIKVLRIENAIMRLAPGKEVPADRFEDLLKLMDTSGIQMTDGVIADKDVEAAIDATLDGRDYLKAKMQSNRNGSPPSKKMLPQQQQQTNQPAKRNRRASM